MRKILEGKTTVITGTARGMGHKMTETFAALGGNVFALARERTREHEDYCAGIAEKYGVKVIPVYFELTDFNAMKEAVRQIRSYALTVDGLVNNAGITHNALMMMTKESDLRRVMEVNFFAPYMLTQNILKLMTRGRRGSIVNIASTAGLDGNSGKSAYGASKAALITLTKCIAEEYGTSGIRANAICPGVTQTDMISYMSEKIRETEINASALGKLGKPEDVANAAAFLISDLSSYITGQVLRVDGAVTSRVKGI